MEDWIDIKDYVGIYQCNREGKVRSLDRLVSWHKTIKKVKGKILSPGINSKGYYVVVLCKGNTRKTVTVHKIIGENLLVKNEKNLEINHKDGIKLNNKLENLEWVTRSENIKHAYKTGLKLVNFCVGERQGSHKIKESQIKSIFELSETKSHSQIAKIFNVHSSTITLILSGKTWKYLGYKHD